MVGKKVVIFGICAFFILLMVGCTKVDGKIRIGITQYVSHVALDSNRKGFMDGLASQGFDDKKVHFIFSNAQGDVATTNIIANDLISKKVDLIMAIATPSAQAVKNVAEDVKIPILFSAVTDPVESGLVESIDHPGGNVTGTSDMAPIDKQLALIKELLPEAKRIGFVYSLGETNSIIQLAQVQDESDKLGLSIVSKGVTTSTELADVLDLLLKEVDVLYIPTDNLVASSMPIVVSKAIEKQIPVIGSEKAHVENGALLTSGIDYYKLGFQTGLMAARILNGEVPNDIPVESLNETEIVINMNTVKALGLTIPQDLLDQATIID
ncbi:ABC transporter substrate-binding protein [Mycoplasmatota bacterium]|nr:ABC transporter substrate-binding protein [Mycoplasmatota bacterium]